MQRLGDCALFILTGRDPAWLLPPGDSLLVAAPGPNAVGTSLFGEWKILHHNAANAFHRIYISAVSSCAPSSSLIHTRSLPGTTCPWFSELLYSWNRCHNACISVWGRSQETREMMRSEKCYIPDWRNKKSRSQGWFQLQETHVSG